MQITAEAQRTQRLEKEESVEYCSTVRMEARSCPGAWYTITRMSLGRRIELTKRIREISRKVEFLEAGNDVRERIEAATLASEIDRLYLEWGLTGVQGLTIDGAPATPETVASAGPEELCREILAAIRAECGLTEDERKN